MLARTYPPLATASSSPAPLPQGARIFAFSGDLLVLTGLAPTSGGTPGTPGSSAREQGGKTRLLSAEELGADGSPRLYLGDLDGAPCFAVTVSPPSDGSSRQALSLFAAYGILREQDWGIASYAVQLLRWQAASQYCMRCRAPLVAATGDWSKRCAACSVSYYPPVSPCVIVLIHDDTRVLMVHQPGWGPMHGLVAGFVEPGESLEECARREVAEEVGLVVDQIRYFGSQTWPFPHQLMVAFSARYVSGEIVRQETELDAAAWFERTALPTIPPRLSLGRTMLDAWLAGQL